MRKLLLLMLCSIVAYGSKAQVNITIDKNGKITDIEKAESDSKKQEDKKKGDTPAISCITLAEDPKEDNQKLKDFIKKNFEALKKEAQLYNQIIQHTTAVTTAESVAPSGYVLTYPTLQYTFASKVSSTVTTTEITTANYTKEAHCAETNATVKHNNTGSIAIVNYYNDKLKSTPDIFKSWVKLQKIETQIFQLRDFIYNIQLATLNDRLTINDDTKEAINSAMLDITTKIGIMERDAEFTAMNQWMCNTSALTGSTYTMNALGIINANKIPAFEDTTTLAANIRSLTAKLNSETVYNYSAMVMEQKRNNLQMQLNKIQAYYKLIAQSAELKKNYAKYTIIGKYIIPKTFDHYRFHNAEDELKLTNSDEAKETIYLNKDKIAIYTYNIPPKGEVSYEMKSAGIVPVLQLTRLAGGLLEQYNKIFAPKTGGTLSLTTTTMPTTGITRLDSYNEQLDVLQKIQDAISIYTANIPPADTLEFADDIDKAYTSRLDKLEELQNDSSYKNTYTLGLKVDGKEVIKPKSFNFITYKRSRIQFAAGVHFFSGNAPMVVTEGTGFKTVSYNTPRYSAGLKVYLLPQTFADVNRHTWFKTTLRSWHLALLVDAAKPLENQYLGIGVDLMPGLGINAGPHFYRYTAYQLYNNAVVGEKKTLKVRDGLQVSLTMDGGLAKDIFTTFLKLF